MAETNAVMAIFLGKNLLGQSDQITHNVDIQIAIFVAASQMVAAYLETLR